MAAVAFWRAGLIVKILWGRFGLSQKLSLSTEKHAGQDSIKM
jgi:hypothetical protein